MRAVRPVRPVGAMPASTELFARIGSLAQKKTGSHSGNFFASTGLPVSTMAYFVSCMFAIVALFAVLCLATISHSVGIPKFSGLCSTVVDGCNIACEAGVC